MEELLEGLKALTVEVSPFQYYHEEVSKMVDAVNALSRLDFGQMTPREKEMVVAKIAKYWECFFEFRQTEDAEKLREGRQHLEDAAGTWK